MIPFGAPGSGKSNLLNMLVGIPGRFASSSSACSGLTQEISFYEGPAFGKSGQRQLRVYDAPGVGDFNIPMGKIIENIMDSVGSKQWFDAALIVIRSTDYRLSVQEMIAIKAIAKLLIDHQPQNIFLIITHCDLQYPSDDLVLGKVASFKKYGGLEIPIENVIKFDNTQKSLEPLIHKITPSDMHFAEDLDVRAEAILQELPGDFKKLDDAEGTKRAEEFKMMLDVMKEQNEHFKKVIAATNQQMYLKLLWY